MPANRDRADDKQQCYDQSGERRRVDGMVAGDGRYGRETAPLATQRPIHMEAGEKQNHRREHERTNEPNRAQDVSINPEFQQSIRLWSRWSFSSFRKSPFKTI